MTIRNATKEDRDQLIGLIHKFDDYYIENNVFSEKLKQFIDYKDKESLFVAMVDEYLNDEKYMMFVSEENGQLVGYICGDVKEKRNRILDKEGFIEDWFVLDTYRGKGVGRELYERLLEEFKKADCNRLGLKAYAPNSTTIAMYERMGFVKTDIVMAKEL